MKTKRRENASQSTEFVAGISECHSTGFERLEEMWSTLNAFTFSLGFGDLRLPRPTKSKLVFKAPKCFVRELDTKLLQSQRVAWWPDSEYTNP